MISTLMASLRRGSLGLQRIRAFRCRASVVVVNWTKQKTFRMFCAAICAESVVAVIARAHGDFPFDGEMKEGGERAGYEMDPVQNRKINARFLLLRSITTCAVNDGASG